MGVLTKIQWTDHTWNPWRGCEHDSPGCDNCYAEAGAARNPAVLGEWGPDGVRSIGADRYWQLPFKWDAEAAAAGERHKVFALSLGDWLEDRRDLDAARARMLATIASTPNLVYLLLTKRPQNFRAVLIRALNILRHQKGGGFDMVGKWHRGGFNMVGKWLGGEPPPNVWVGASIEDQIRFEQRRDPLREVPARIHFFSAEPLLGDIDIRFLTGVEWIVIGGESGHSARICLLDAIRSLIVQCRAAGIAPYVKQIGAVPIGHDGETAVIGAKQQPFGNGSWRRLQDPKGGDPDEWPKDLRVREFPA